MLNFNNNSAQEHDFVTHDNTKRLVPLESILVDIYRVIGSNYPVSEDDLLESAALALDHLLTYKMFEKVACLKIIDDHNVEISEPFSEIEAVLYSPVLEDDDLSEIIQTTTVDICNHTVSKKSLYSLIKCNCLSKWKWLSVGHSISTMMQNCDVPPIGCACDDSYIVKGNMINISQKNGYVIVIYKRVIKDDETGSLLMPDHPLVKLAIKNYVLMEIYERKMLMHEEGSIGLYDRYLKQWEISSASAIGETIKPSLPEWIEIVKLNRFFKDDSPYRIFDQTGFEKFNPF